MRFVDSNVFIYAFLKPKRKLSAADSKIKNAAKTITKRIENGEGVATSVVHLSEVVNLLEKHMSLENQKEFLDSVFFAENIDVLTVDKDVYLLGADLAAEHRIGINDGLAAVLMQKEDIEEIYSFDRHFDLLPDVKRVWK